MPDQPGKGRARPVVSQIKKKEAAEQQAKQEQQERDAKKEQQTTEGHAAAAADVAVAVDEADVEALFAGLKKKKKNLLVLKKLEDKRMFIHYLNAMLI